MSHSVSKNRRVQTNLKKKPGYVNTNKVILALNYLCTSMCLINNRMQIFQCLWFDKKGSQILSFWLKKGLSRLYAIINFPWKIEDTCVWYVKVGFLNLIIGLLQL